MKRIRRPPHYRECSILTKLCWQSATWRYADRIQGVFEYNTDCNQLDDRRKAIFTHLWGEPTGRFRRATGWWEGTKRALVFKSFVWGPERLLGNGQLPLPTSKSGRPYTMTEQIKAFWACIFLVSLPLLLSFTLSSHDIILHLNPSNSRLTRHGLWRFVELGTNAGWCTFCKWCSSR